MKNISKKVILIISAICACIGTMIQSTKCYAIGQFALSPMYQLVTLIPGETYTGSFTVINPADNPYNFYYTVDIKPFSVGDNNDLAFTENGNYNQIVDWIDLSAKQGVVSTNSNQEIRFYIHVPEDAPAGGQYASITVTSAQYLVDNQTVDLRESYAATHLIYANVAGETVRKGTIEDVNVPSFLLSGNIAGSANITNEGNVHSQSTQIMQIYPLFSGEEIFTNEEEPKSGWIMPGATNYSSVTWDNTPSVGIFHVIYNVEYEGVESTIDKYVIVCPLWLLFIILLAFILIAMRFIFGNKRK